MLQSGKVDIADHQRRAGGTRGLTAVPLRETKMFLVARPDHPLASRETVNPRELENHPFIGYEEESETRMMMDAFFRRMSLSIEYALESSNVATIKHMVMAGLGLSILPEMAVGDEIRDGRLVRIDVQGLYMAQRMTLYYKTNRTLTPTRREFLNFLQRTLGAERELGAERRAKREDRAVRSGRVRGRGFIVKMRWRRVWCVVYNRPIDGENNMMTRSRVWSLFWSVSSSGLPCGTGRGRARQRSRPSSRIKVGGAREGTRGRRGEARLDTKGRGEHARRVQGAGGRLAQVELRDAHRPGEERFSGRRRSAQGEPHRRSTVRSARSRRTARAPTRRWSSDLTQLRDTHAKLQQSTITLTEALRSPTVRGRWGEIQLRRVVEMAGMVNHVAFDEQATTDLGRPDMIAYLPNGGVLPVDSKVPLTAYLAAMEARTTTRARTTFANTRRRCGPA